MKGVFYDLPNKYKYSIAFNAKINPLVSSDIDKYISVASQSNFRKFLPKDIDFEKKVDFLGFAGEFFHVNRANLNNDGIRNKEAIEIAKLLPWTLVDFNHDRAQTVGVITNASFIEFGTNKIITEEEAKELKSPFTCVIGGILWRLANPDLAELVEDSSINPKSELYGNVFLSWELMFSESNLLLIEPKKYNFEDAKKWVTDASEISKLEKKLIALGGNGLTDDGMKIVRVPINDAIPAGAGIVQNPAASPLKPIITHLEEEEDKDSKASISLENNDKIIEFSIDTKMELINNKDEAEIILTVADLEDYKGEELTDDLIKAAIERYNGKLTSEDCKITLKAYFDRNPRKNENSISQSNNINVNQEDKKNFSMKINNIAEITDEKLKEIKASEIVNFYDAEIKKISDEWVSKNTKTEKDLKTANDSLAEIQEKNKKTEEKLSQIEVEFNKMVEANKQKEQVEVFSARMQTLADTFDLTKEESDILAEDIKSIDKDEDFTKFIQKQEVLMAAKKKSNKVFDPKTKKWVNKEDMEKKEEVKASTEEVNTQAALDKALKDAEKDKQIIANAADNAEKSVNDKYKAAFGNDGWKVEDKRKNRV